MLTSRPSVAALRNRRYDRRHMLDDTLRRTTIFRRLSEEDRRRIGAVASLREFGKGDLLFSEGDASDHLYVIVSGRVKVFKTTARGTDVILELFGPGDQARSLGLIDPHFDVDRRGHAAPATAAPRPRQSRRIAS